MDQEGALDQSIVPKLFDMGLMGIEVPEQYQGSESSFLYGLLSRRVLSRPFRRCYGRCTEHLSEQCVFALGK